MYSGIYIYRLHSLFGIGFSTSHSELKVSHLYSDKVCSLAQIQELKTKLNVCDKGIKLAWSLLEFAGEY